MSNSYHLELSPAAKRDLKRLPERIQKEIVFTHLPRIAENPLEVGERLQGALKGELSYHFGRKPEYRIIYHVEDNLITVTIIGTRENIYRRALRRNR